MNLKKFSYLFTFAVLVLSGSLFSQPVLSPVNSIGEFRNIGETRVWEIEINGEIAGYLKSQLVGSQEINSYKTFQFNQELKLKYLSGNVEQKRLTKGNFFVSDKGFFNGNQKTITIGEFTEKIEFERSGSIIEGFFTRGGKQIEQSVVMAEYIKPLGNNYFDQYELIFAREEIFVGKSINIDVFDPISLTENSLVGEVTRFGFIPLHTELSDSVYVIELTSPQNMTLYYSKDRKLQKIDIPDYKMKVYLDTVINEVNELPIRSTVSVSKSISFIPNYLVFLLISLISLLMFLGKGYRWKETYIAFALGGIAYFIIPYTQFPVQSYFFKQFILPAFQSGQFSYLQGSLPSVAGGIIQESLKIILIFVILRLLKPKSYQLIAIGAAVGAGFGLIESSYLATLSGNNELFSWLLLEKSSLIKFHSGSGALLGWAMSKSFSDLMKIGAITTLINSFMRFLPVFVQQNVLSFELINLIVAFLAVMFLSISLWIIKRGQY